MERKQDASQGIGKGRSSNSQGGHNMQEDDDNAKPSDQGRKEDVANETSHNKRQTNKEASFAVRKKLKRDDAEAGEEHVSAARDLTGCTSSSIE